MIPAAASHSSPIEFLVLHTHRDVDLRPLSFSSTSLEISIAKKGSLKIANDDVDLKHAFNGKVRRPKANDDARDASASKSVSSDADVANRVFV